MPTHDDTTTTRLRSTVAALGQLLEQAYQMQGLFDDEDGTIQAAIDDAEEAEAHANAHLSAMQET